MRKSISKVISKENVVEMERWQCPSVNAASVKEGSGLGLLTAEKIEKFQRQAFKQAYDEGYKKGFKAGVDDGNKSMQPKMDAVIGVLNNLSRPMDSLNIEVEQQLVQLAVLLTKQLVRREIKQDPGQIVAVVRDAVSLLPISSNHLQIRVHPQDHLVLLDVFKSLTEADQWQFVEDITLQRGDCIVNTEFSSIDATVETRLTAMLIEMLGSERTSDKVDDAEQKNTEVRDS